jgi:hypothetical protein
MHENLTEEQERAQGHPTPWATMWDHAKEPAFDDAGPSYHPGDRSTAARHARQVKAREAEARQLRDLETIAKAADEQNDDRALEQATDLLQRGKDVPAGLRIRAARAANRRGESIPTAELLAARRR